MNKKIKSIVADFLKKREIVSSWGISNILITENSIHFQVEGFIYRGSISIKCDKSSCQIEVDGGKIIQCPVNELINTLDLIIEKDENYHQNLATWILSQMD